MKYTFISIFIFFQLVSNAQQEITLDDIFTNNKFKVDAVTGFKSMIDGKFYSEINAEKKLVQVNFKDGKVKQVLADFDKLMVSGEKINVENYQFNNTETKLLIFTNSQNIYRRSVLNNVFIYDIKSKEIHSICNQKILHTTFNPQGNKVAYVKNNNLFIYDLETESEKQITTDGEKNKIINGNCDWVYEEEFGFSKAFEWSPNGLYIAYYRFDESNVKEYNFAVYDSLYPKDVKYKYPKAGEENSKIEIYLYNIEQNKKTKVDIGNNQDIYIPRIRWTQFDNQLLIYKLNRLQNKLTIFGQKPNNTESELVYNEDNDAYIEIKDNIEFFKTQNVFLYTSEKKGFNHIWIHDMNNGSDAQLTNGNWEVTNLLGVDEVAKKIYYISTENSPLERQLYSISYDGKTKQQITKEKGTHTIEFSKGFQYFIDNYSAINQPPTYTIKDNKGVVLRTLKDNANLKNLIQTYKIANQKLIQIPNGYGDTLNAWIMMDENTTVKHPLLMFQYSGPGSQQVSNNYMGRDFWWYQMLVQKGYAIVCVDGRGTGFRGEKFKKCTYKQLGKLESDDQIASAKYFGNLPYIDKNRIGIWGWSYGGYMSSICILKGADVFKSAIAVAPVTNWRYYDNIYTERYMQKPQDNASGYDNNSPINMVKNLKGNYLLIHGSADDNVHYQNTMEMINALIKENKDFDSETYPNRAHGISGGNTRLHLYKRLTKFVLEKI